MLAVVQGLLFTSLSHDQTAVRGHVRVGGVVYVYVYGHGGPVNVAVAVYESRKRERGRERPHQEAPP